MTGFHGNNDRRRALTAWSQSCLELRDHNARSLAVDVARFGLHLEVLDPPAVREQLHQIGADLVDLYRQTEA